MDKEEGWRKTGSCGLLKDLFREAISHHLAQLAWDGDKNEYRFLVYKDQFGNEPGQDVTAMASKATDTLRELGGVLAEQDKKKWPSIPVDTLNDSFSRMEGVNSLSNSGISCFMANGKSETYLKCKSSCQIGNKRQILLFSDDEKVGAAFIKGPKCGHHEKIAKWLPHLARDGGCKHETGRIPSIQGCHFESELVAWKASNTTQ